VGKLKHFLQCVHTSDDMKMWSDIIVGLVVCYVGGFCSDVGHKIV